MEFHLSLTHAGRPNYRHLAKAIYENMGSGKRVWLMIDVEE